MKFNLFLLVLFMSLNLFAADAPKIEIPKQAPLQLEGYNFASLALGISRTTGANSGRIPLRFAYGLEYAFAVSKEFAIGGFVSRNNGPVSSGSNIDLAIVRVGAQAIYNPLRDLFIDLRTGVGFISASANLGNSLIVKSDTNHPLFIGPGVGLMIPVMDKIAFSPSMHYTYFFSNSDIEHFGVIEFTGAVRYQF